MLPLVVQVRDRNMDLVGVLSEEDLADFQIFPAKNNVGTWSLTLPHLVRSSSGQWVRHSLGEALATPGSGISVSLPGGRRFSGPMLTPEFQASTSDVGGTWTFTGVSDTIVLADRVAFPDPTIEDPQASSQSKAYDVRTGPAETVMRAYVDANIGPSAPAGRRDNRVIMSADQGRGSSRTKSARFASLLDLCRELAVADGLLFDVVQVGHSLEFQVWEAQDLTAAVRMDIESDQLAATKYSYSAPAATRVIVMAQGEGTERLIRTRTNAAALAASANWGRVIERTVDQRQTDDLDEIDAAGDEVLATDGTQIQSVNVTPSDVNAQTVGLKWWVGDLVTVNVAGQPIAADIATIRLSVSSDGIFAGATIGDPVGFDADRVTNSRVGSVESRVGSLERNAEAPGLEPLEGRITELEDARTAFVAFQAAGTAIVSKSGATTESALVFGNVRLNIGDAYDPATGGFTAPVSGVYRFDFSLCSTTTTGGPEGMVYKNGALEYETLAIGYGVVYMTFGSSAVMELAEGDLIQVFWRNNNNVAASLDGTRSNFSGHLISS